jgi:hypothetical protein
MKVKYLVCLAIMTLLANQAHANSLINMAKQWQKQGTGHTTQFAGVRVDSSGRGFQKAGQSVLLKGNLPGQVNLKQEQSFREETQLSLSNGGSSLVQNLLGKATMLMKLNAALVYVDPQGRQTYDANQVHGIWVKDSTAADGTRIIVTGAHNALNMNLGQNFYTCPPDTITGKVVGTNLVELNQTYATPLPGGSYNNTIFVRSNQEGSAKSGN